MSRMRWFPERSVVSPLFAASFNILLALAAFSLERVEYLLENLEYFKPTIGEGRLAGVFFAGVLFDVPGVFYVNALYILLMLLPLHIKENRRWYGFCKWVFIIFNTAALIVNLADSVYYSYTLRRTSWSIFGEFANESNFGKIVAVELLRHWYLVVFAATLVWGMWKLYVSPQMEIKRQPLWRYYLVSILSLAAGAATVIGGIRGGWLNHWYNYIAAALLLYIGWRLLKKPESGRKMKTAGWVCMGVAAVLLAIAPIGGWRHRDIRPIAISNANARAASPAEAALILNTPFTLIRSIGNVPFADPHYFDDKAQLNALYTPLHCPSDSVTPNRKNLCIIIIESFGREYIGAMNDDILGPGTETFTPFTDSLLNHCAWWKHSFDNGQKSIDAMPGILAGIPSFVRPFIVTPQAVNKLEGIPGALAADGYSTAFFHGARTGSMGFDGFARSIGFKDYYGREDFEKDKRFGGIGDFDGYWAIWDEPFLKWFALKMSEMPQPFMTAIFTASNHHPFRIPTQYEGRFPEGTMPIHKTAGYTDNALRQFFAVAKTQPWYDDTVFVITNDHTNMRSHDEYRSSIGSFYGPVLIFDPSGEIAPGKREGIAQQTDIMPTMLNYLGHEKPFVAFGIDLFSTPDDATWAVNHIGGNYQFVKEGHILVFDGTKTTGLYAINDHLMATNLKDDPGKREIMEEMETELKAIIQSYMDRMLGDSLTAG